tara:strand:- start:619 stop:1002 length:384 start_codon:yes stop_codon:yes gene_type:complete
MKKSTLRKLCLFSNFILIMPLAIIVIIAIFEGGLPPLIFALMLFLLTLPTANFFHIYYKKKNFLLRVINHIAIFFCFLLMIGFMGMDPADRVEETWVALIATPTFLIFIFSDAYISGAEKWWLNSDK